MNDLVFCLDVLVTIEKLLAVHVNFGFLRVNSHRDPEFHDTKVSNSLVISGQHVAPRARACTRVYARPRARAREHRVLA